MDFLSSLKSRLTQAKSGFSSLVSNTLKSAGTSVSKTGSEMAAVQEWGRANKMPVATPIAGKPLPSFVEKFAEGKFEVPKVVKKYAPQVGYPLELGINFAKNIVFKNPSEERVVRGAEKKILAGLPLTSEENKMYKKAQENFAINVAGFSSPIRARADVFGKSGPALTKRLGEQKAFTAKVLEGLESQMAKIPVPAGMRRVFAVEGVGGTNWRAKSIQQLKDYIRSDDISKFRAFAEDVPINKLRETSNGFFQVIDDVGTKTVGAIDNTVVESQSAIQNIMKALKEAGPVRGAQEEIYTKTRAARMKLAEQAGEAAGGGVAGYKAELGALKGEMGKVDFTPLKISQGDMDGVFRAVKESSGLTWWEKITARNGLAKLFGEVGGAVPTENEIALMRKAFPPEFVEEILSKRSNLQKAYEAGVNILNVPRALMSSFDLSAPLRQGIFLIGRPKQWGPAFKDMFKYAFSQKAYDNLGMEIMSRPNYSKFRDARLAITDMGSITTREEAFMSNLAERIPGIGKIVKGSNRAYSGFLTKLRADVADDLIKTAEKQGVNVMEGSKALKDIGSFVNAATGRGNLGALEKAAPVLNSLFFSPRLMASRVNLLNPIYYYKLDPFVRKEALKSLFTFVGTGMTVLGLTKLAGGDEVEIGTNPTSADFGKVKIGNTRYDTWGGFQQYVKLVAQLMRGEITSTTSGKVYKVGEGYKPITRLELLYRFGEQKESPIASFATGLLKGRDFTGQPFNVTEEIRNRFIPMIIQDTMEIIEERGASGILMEIPGIFGVGTQTYTEPIKKPTLTKPSGTTFKKPGPAFKEGFSLK